MNIDDALEAMDEILDKSMQVPFSQKKGMVDVSALRDLIDDIRMNMPNEITQARNLVNDRNNFKRREAGSGTNYPQSGGKSRTSCFSAGDYKTGKRESHSDTYQRSD